MEHMIAHRDLANGYGRPDPDKLAEASHLVMVIGARLASLNFVIPEDEILEKDHCDYFGPCGKIRMEAKLGRDYRMTHEWEFTCSQEACEEIRGHLGAIYRPWGFTVETEC